MPFTDWSTGDVITATKLDNDNTVSVGTDTARTVTVTHTFTASQTLTGGWTAAAACTITAASATAFAVGRQGATDPVLLVHSSTASQATGIKITGAAAASGVAIAAISSGTNEALTIDAKGSGTITLGGTSTGAITLTRATTISAALTYGGVTLSNAVTGTGNMVLSASPTFTGTITAAAITASGTAYIGDTANANVTLGLTINQGANDDDILSLKSSDVAHGMTDLTETDTFGSVAKANGTEGGLFWQGFAEGTGAVFLRGHHTTDNTAKLTTAVGCVTIDARLKAAATSGSCGADANLVVIRNDATARFLFDAEGTFHADVSSTTF